MSDTSCRIPQGGLIDRAAPRAFTWNGEPLQGYAGDTLASALLANGQQLVGRSFKYHRRRGIVAAGAEEPNGIVQVGHGAWTVPNMRATQVELYEGLDARSVNCWPSLEVDVGELNSWFARLLPAGFYYKTFMWPQSMWHTYEAVIRRAAGLGTAPTAPDPENYDKMHAHCDVLIVGAGPAGLAAALSAGRRGARVILLEQQSDAGGSALHLDEQINGVDAVQWARDSYQELLGLDNVRVLLRTTGLGLYERNFLVASERMTDHLPNGERHGPRERLWRIRAARIVLATGAFERSLVFGNNDLPGVMLADAVSVYLRRYGVLCGRRVVVFTNNDTGYRTALDLAGHAASVRVVDARPSAEGALVARAEAAGIAVVRGHVVTAAVGRKRVTGAELMAMSDGKLTGNMSVEPCDLIAMSGGWSPALHLHSHGGGRARYDAELACYVPDVAQQDCQSVGAANGEFGFASALRAGHQEGNEASRATAGGRARGRMPEATDLATSPTMALWQVPARRGVRGPKAFVDMQNDTAASDLQLAVREGFESIEHVKRYTALGFGTDQGKLGNINGMGIVAEALGVSPGEVGTTTFRPPYSPVTFGAVAGADVGPERFDAVRKTAMHELHAEAGAEFELVGQWLRPWYYPKGDEDIHAAVARECLAVRHSVGMMDASTLGKIDVRGPDAAEFLDRIYTNGWKKLAVGRARYGLMLGEDGMVMDDGVSARIADDHYYMTTTTGGAAHVLGWMERWLQTEWPELKVYLTSVTDAWSTIAVAGPRARTVLETVGTDIDLSAQSLGFMCWAEGKVAGLPARVVRVSFSGESAFEINVSANLGAALWRAVAEAGSEFGITPYGTETMHVLRAEKGFVIVGQDTDGSVTPDDLGMSWIVAKHKDFLGKRSLSRSDCVRPDRKHLVGLLTSDGSEVLPEGAQLVAEPFTRLPVPMVGHVTSSYWSATLGRSIALALVKGGRSRQGETIYAPLVDGRLVPAQVTSPVFYDPKGARMHA
ncbi:MAG: sarcosine oxidase subunit alpha family protein [Pseudomonadota bacterium]